MVNLDCQLAHLGRECLFEDSVRLALGCDCGRAQATVGGAIPRPMGLDLIRKVVDHIWEQASEQGSSKVSAPVPA